jgi:hypothetical protein
MYIYYIVMSSNLSVVNFAVGGGLTVSGKMTLAETLLSSSTASFQGLSTTSLTTTGTSTFDGSLPTSTQTPTLDSELTTKIYVDTADTTLNTRITNTDADQRTYIDGSYNELNTRITDTDADQRTYIDGSYNELNTRITNTDADQRTYIDGSYNTLNTRITDTDADQRTYIDGSYNTLNTRITDTDADQKTYIDGSYNTLNTRITETANSIRPNRNYTISRNGEFFSSKTFNTDQFQFGASTYIQCENNVDGSPYSIIFDDPRICGGLIIYIWNNSSKEVQIQNKTAQYFLKLRTSQNEKRQPNATMFLISNSVGWVVLGDNF